MSAADDAFDALPGSAGHDAEQGIRVAGGDQCYLCERDVRDGDAIVYYFDEQFWKQGFIYHHTCWHDADLAAKDFGEPGPRYGRALVLSELTCLGCGQSIAVGDDVGRVRGSAPLVDGAGSPSLTPRVYHVDCLPDAPA